MKKNLRTYHRVSRLFQPVNIVPAGAHVKTTDSTSKSHKLMIDEGIIATSQNGFFYNLPLATRAFEKLTKLIDNNMADIGAQKISCPTLTSSNVWEKSGRLSTAGSEIFRLDDRHEKNFLLSPTHEESVTQLLASSPQMSYKQLPLLLYQITSKFRDEARPRFGLIRAREFLMKDLYSFDSSPESAQETYNLVTQAYQRIFQTIGVNFVKVKGVPGLMGGDVSHEFHYPADIGDDTLRLCESCGSGWNKEADKETKCGNCGSEAVVEKKGIEVGHMFQLGTRYSSPLQALYVGVKGRLPLVMGSYGLGMSRILAASLEALSLPDQLRWPSVLAPFSLVIVTPKDGSKESKLTEHIPEELYWRLQEVPQLEDNVIIDDRSHMTIGKRVLEAKRKGYPYIAVVGRAAAEQNPQIELIDVHSGDTSLHGLGDLINVMVSNDQHIRLKLSQ